VLSKESIDVIVHSTHEAAVKIGGIGAVLEGLLSAQPYLKNVRRTILVGPLELSDRAALERLLAPSSGFCPLYWAERGILAVEPLAGALRSLEETFGVCIVYGRKRIGPAEHEVLLLDGSAADRGRVNVAKYRLWERFGLQSDRYEMVEDYDRYVRIAEPSYRALEAILGEDLGRRRKVLVAHEFMGVPLCLWAELERPGGFCRVYYAHEVPPVRVAVEGHPGHDTRFYNVLRLAQRESLTFAEVFGDQSHFYKYALLELAGDFDAIFAVGDLVVEELRFLGAQFATRAIDLVYNGISAPALSPAEKEHSRDKLRAYAKALLGVEPDLILSHVARLVPSKALWRDFRVLEALDEHLAEQGRKAVFFVLASSLATGRLAEDVRRMEREYGWPVQHRLGYPDLVGEEAELFSVVEEFNKRAAATRVVFVNQFGWDRERCGERMPADMSFADLRIGTDLEFGQSIYEPFGIAQLEPLPFGALCLVSSACGCVGFANRVATSMERNVVVADYISLPPELSICRWQDALQIGKERRELVEAKRAQEVAAIVARNLPKSASERAALLRAGHALAARMNWGHVVSEYMLPALVRALHS
jgi:hypothetical protein